MATAAQKAARKKFTEMVKAKSAAASAPKKPAKSAKKK